MKASPDLQVEPGETTPVEPDQPGRAGEADSQGVKDRGAASDQYGDPDHCEPAGTIPGRTG
jgi:hypothetical protein